MTAPFRDNEQLDLLRGFVEEGRDMLDEVEPKLIELEKGSHQCGDLDPEVLNAIFRLFHSLKGSAGYLGLITLNRVTHQAEALLDLFRKKVAVFASEHVDLLIQSCDFLRQLLDNVELKRDDQGFDTEADQVVEALQQAISAIQNPNRVSTPKETPRSKSSRKAKSESESKKAPTEKETQSVVEPDSSVDQPLDMLLTITPELVGQFATESHELLEIAESGLLALEKDASNATHLNQAFRALHSFKGNSGLLGYSDLESLSHQVETVLEKLQEGTIPAPVETYSLILEVIDVLRNVLVQLHDGGNPKISGLIGWISLLQEVQGGSQAGGVLGAGNGSTEDLEAETAAQALITELTGSASEAADTGKTARAPWLEKVAPVRGGGPSIQEDHNTGEDRRTGRDRRQKETTTLQKQSVRVDVDKLDVLLDLVGELVIAEAMVTQNPDLKAANVSLDRFEKSVLHLGRISRDLQNVITTIRMIPLSGTFRRMIRLVRDLGQKAAKKVELEIIGEETEVDKTVIEQINDPLVHLIRNAIDHGCEPPEQRVAQGKPPQATVTLEARYVGSEVWIFIKDDGRGLNREKILAKALKRGLISDEGVPLTDAEVWPMVFLPGFSTAEVVTDVSGRGVGMDVVRRNIEGLRGKVEVRSREGQGSTFILRLPLTLAIIDGMLVRVGRERYIIPIASIKEALKPREQDFTQMMDGQELLNVHGQLIPVVRLHEIFDLKSDYTALQDGLILQVENEHRSLCLFVDELIGQQQTVIKGLSSYLGSLPGISGCTIMGNGEISLIIDIAGIFHHAQQVAASVRHSGRTSTPRAATCA